jgi:hypothetical protein
VGETEDELSECFGDEESVEKIAARKVCDGRLIVDGESHPIYANSQVFDALMAALGMPTGSTDELQGFTTPTRVARTAKRPRIVLWTVMALVAIVIILRFLVRH